jgi:hypothetical protein
MPEIADTREAIKTAISSVAANVYDFVPETPQVPFAAVVPGSPYWEFETIGKTTFRCKLNFLISVGCCLFFLTQPVKQFGSLDKIHCPGSTKRLRTSVVESPVVNTVGTIRF